MFKLQTLVITMILFSKTAQAKPDANTAVTKLLLTELANHADQWEPNIFGKSSIHLMTKEGAFKLELKKGTLAVETIFNASNEELKNPQKSFSAQEQKTSIRYKLFTAYNATNTELNKKNKPLDAYTNSTQTITHRNSPCIKSVTTITDAFSVLPELHEDLSQKLLLFMSQFKKQTRS